MYRAVCLTALACAVAHAKYLTDEELVALYGRVPPPPTPPKLRYLSGGLLNANQTLREAAAARGIFIGTALNLGCLQNASDPLYSSVALAQYNIATAEVECKFAPTEPQQGQFSYSGCAGVAAAMTGAGGSFRGHNFVWGLSNPAWLVNGSFTPAGLQGVMASHIGNLSTHFAGSGFYSQDVVNECFTNNFTQGGDPFKPAAPWYPALPNYVDTALQLARAADATGRVKLFINEYGAEGLSVKSDVVYNYSVAALKRGVPLHGIGLQMHISVDSYPPPADVSANIARLTALGLEVHITEMDVRCTPPCGADRLALQAHIYGQLLSACLSHPGCKSFETWGYTDRHTWLWDYDNPTHANMQPLPFDINYQPKPAYFEMLATLQSSV